MPETAAPAAPAHTRHRLAWLDQLAYELFRVTGRSQRIQCLWLYDREVNVAALERTHQRLTALPFNRLIEPSPLPLGRPRWVRPADGSAPFLKGSDVLPRTQLLDWANAQARMPVDPVKGPAGRMAVQAFDDGTTAVSIVGSHLVIDGMGAIRAIEAAASGADVPDLYLRQGARRWLAGCASDARQILADAPRTLAALARVARARWSNPVAEQRAVTAVDALDDRPDMVELPAVSATIDAQLWDACAERLGGYSHTLFPGFVAALASNLGRCRPSDGAVTLLVPVDRRRGPNDDRALAIEFGTMTVAPTGLAENLQPLDAPLRALFRGTKKKNETDALTALLPAVAWMPRTIATAIVNQLFNYADGLPVSCSNLGTLPYGIGRIDGSPCKQVLARAVDVNVSRRDLERSHGHLVVVGSRYKNTISLCIEACQLRPTPTTIGELRLVTERTLAEFGLEAVIDA